MDLECGGHAAALDCGAHGAAERLERIFFAVLDCPADERNRLVELLCDGDVDLERDVHSLLEHYDDEARIFAARSRFLLPSGPCPPTGGAK